MNKHSSLRTSGSLLERASELYDFGAAMRAAPLPLVEPELRASPEPALPTAPEPATASDAFPELPRRPKKPLVLSTPAEEEAKAAPFAGPQAMPRAASAPMARNPAPTGRLGVVDRASLLEGGFILPEAPVTGLAEEFRIIKRQLLQRVSPQGGIAEGKRQTILVCSATPDEGKTFSAVNLALSLASEKDVEVLLVDGDFSKPEVLSILGLEGGQGLIDAIAHPGADPNDFIIQTDIERLSVLPAGRQANNVTELLASERTLEVFEALTQGHPRRIVIFDSPPALMASPASVLAAKVGQIMMVVRADQTTEAELREAIGLLSGCEHVSLMLNGVGFAATGRRFGTYYGYGQ
jgi:exopolysaccharide/PEP-CTERM locus tyrosine autokinase